MGRPCATLSVTVTTPVYQMHLLKGLVRGAPLWTVLRPDETAQRIARLRAMPYREYLLTLEWQARRRRALKLANYRCLTCNNTKHLEVHHRTYERLGTEWDEDLIVLCRGCHGLFHSNGRLSG